MKKFTVNLVKNDGAKSTYFVLAMSEGGAENAVLKNVYAAKFALAAKGWPAGVRSHDLFSDAVASHAVSMMMTA
jgi:hypothetical protein